MTGSPGTSSDTGRAAGAEDRSLLSSSAVMAAGTAVTPARNNAASVTTRLV